MGGGDKLLLLFVYSFQIYADFFGYSTIALALALLFGYRLPVNFRLPYTSSSFSDFWNRWHISLSRWLRVYLYVPLGGNRTGAIRTYINLLLVMVLGGLWHGAAISYAVWGLAHGLLLAGERIVSRSLSRYLPHLSFNFAARCAYGLFVFVCVSLCWLLFRFQDFSDASAYFSSIKNEPMKFGLEDTWYRFAAIYMAPVVIQHAVTPRILLNNTVLWGMLYGGMLWFAFAERGADTPFIYFRF